MTPTAWGRLATALVIVGVVGAGWRLSARHERLVRPVLEAGAASVEAGAAGPLRLQPLVCAAAAGAGAGTGAEASAEAGDTASPFEGAALALTVGDAANIQQRWALGEVEEVRRGELRCVSLAPVEVEEAAAYRLRVEGGDPAALTLEVVESSPLGWRDWVWCGLLLAAMAARLRGWTTRPAPTAPTVLTVGAGGEARPLWGRSHPALGLLVFVLAQGVVAGGVLPLVARGLRLAQGSALSMMAQALVIAGVHLGIVYGLARAEHPDKATARAALGTHARVGAWGRPWRAAIGGAALGVGATVMLALIVRGPSETSAMQEAVRMPGSMLALAAMATLSPWYEELFFRGYLQGALTARVGVYAAAVVSAALFALVHVPQHLGYLWPVLPIFLVSAAAAALRAVSGSTAAPFALHLGYNAALVLPAMFAP